MKTTRRKFTSKFEAQGAMDAVTERERMTERVKRGTWRGYLYLTAIIDVYSRFVVGWQLSNSLDKETQTTLLRDAVGRYDKPEIINSDQGSQYTCEHWVSTLKELEIQTL